MPVASAPRSLRASSISAATAGARAGRRLDEQQPIPLLLGKQRQEVRLRHQQLPLEDAVAQRRHEPQADLPCPARDHDVLAEPAVQHVGHRIRVGDDGDDGAVRLVGVAIQEQPGVGALGLGRGERVLKREAARREK